MTTTEPLSTRPATEPAAPMYQLVKVTKTYQQKRKSVAALIDVDLTIPRGQLVAIQGPTGGGKSTLLQMLGALDRPTSGDVSFNERNVAKLGDRALTAIRATQIGFVFQSFNL
ncbi:MAG: peptide transporter ATP-binding protein, partial [Pseudonocardiales bacterium]|nr:peptide transporter ATP-binding protein [Pseudonocardiales bacterium]